MTIKSKVDVQIYETQRAVGAAASSGHLRVLL